MYLPYTGDDAGAEAVRRAGAEPVAAAAVRRVLAQRDPALPRGQQDHLHLRNAHPQRQRLQGTGKHESINPISQWQMHSPTEVQPGLGPRLCRSFAY